jgi:predicted dehydrogenase
LADPHAIRFGIIGLGMMGREFGSAVLRWCHLLDTGVVPRITAVCAASDARFDWFTTNFDSIQQVTTDYHDLLDRDLVDAIYCAVPHHLHAQMYTDIIEAGIHLLGEKPFGIDLAANQQIMEAVLTHPDVFVACVSQFPFFPGAQRIVQLMRDDAFGRIIEVEAGLLHSSDLNPDKPINWKRMVSTNGEYGCMGDLGMHVLHVPLRVGWRPQNVHARLSNIVTERFNSEGKKVPCETWDNAIIDCEVSKDDYTFPMTLKTHRIAPGEMNTWYLRVLGTERSAAYSTKYPRTLRIMDYTPGQEQGWREIDLGYQSAYPTITAGIFEFGQPSALLQMWAAYCDELAHGREGMAQPFYCATPQETHLQHLIFTAALESNRTKRVVALDEVSRGRADAQ